MIYYHIPRCSKSREGLKILESINKDIRIKFYLSEKISFIELEEIIKKLKIKPIDLVRKRENIIKEKKLDFSKFSDKEIIKILIKYPVLIERPILITKNKAIIGRPPEVIKTIL